LAKDLFPGRWIVGGKKRGKNGRQVVRGHLIMRYFAPDCQGLVWSKYFGLVRIRATVP
jgi:hypothetical protein